MRFDRTKLNRAIVVLLHHTLVMEPASRIRISPENRRRIAKDREAIEHLLQFAERAIKELGIGEEPKLRNRLNVRPADLQGMH